MLTRLSVLVKWSNDWRNLKAWGRSLAKVEIEISHRECLDRLGTCWAHEQRLVVYKGASIQKDLDTLIHEMAHAATPGDRHGMRWQNAYSSAVEEVTGIPVPRAAPNYQILCQAGKAAVASWWTSSGHEMLWKMFRGKS